MQRGYELPCRMNRLGIRIAWPITANNVCARITRADASGGAKNILAGLRFKSCGKSATQLRDNSGSENSLAAPLDVTRD